MTLVRVKDSRWGLWEQRPGPVSGVQFEVKRFREVPEAEQELVERCARAMWETGEERLQRRLDWEPEAWEDMGSRWRDDTLDDVRAVLVAAGVLASADKDSHERELSTKRAPGRAERG